MFDLVADMSFADLKSKRQPKNSKSYVSALSGPVASVPIQSSPQASMPAIRDNVVVDTQSLYPQLPPALEIRETDHSGRGLWVQQYFKSGITILQIPGQFVDVSRFISRIHRPFYSSPCVRPL